MKNVKVKVKDSRKSVKPGDIIEFELNGVTTREEITYVGFNRVEGMVYDLTMLILAGNFKIV